MLNSCFFSSLIFLSNVIIALKNKYIFYALLFILLIITSLIYHTKPNIYTNIIDKISICLIVIYGGYLFSKKCLKNNKKIIQKITIIITFLTTIYLYTYGYYRKKYCFTKNTKIANLYHSLLHVISSIGHHLIIIL